MKGHTGKKAVNRHQTQSKASAGAQERAIERKERQRGAKEVRVEARKPVDCDGCGMPRFDVKAVGRDSNGDPDAPSLCFICRVEWERGRTYDRKAKRYMRVDEYEEEREARRCVACNGSGHYDTTGSPPCAACCGTGLRENTTEGAAAHWRQLAKDERAKLTWDKHLLPAIAEARAKSYEGAALAIEKTAATGIPHCACHIIPLADCARRKVKAS
jgi:hypothetical protein